MRRGIYYPARRKSLRKIQFNIFLKTSEWEGEREKRFGSKFWTRIQQEETLFRGHFLKEEEALLFKLSKEEAKRNRSRGVLFLHWAPHAEQVILTCTVWRNDSNWTRRRQPAACCWLPQCNNNNATKVPPSPPLPCLKTSIHRPSPPASSSPSLPPPSK